MKIIGIVTLAVVLVVAVLLLTGHRPGSHLGMPVSASHSMMLAEPWSVR